MSDKTLSSKKYLLLLKGDILEKLSDDEVSNYWYLITAHKPQSVKLQNDGTFMLEVVTVGASKAPPSTILMKGKKVKVNVKLRLQFCNLPICIDENAIREAIDLTCGDFTFSLKNVNIVDVGGVYNGSAEIFFENCNDCDEFASWVQDRSVYVMGSLVTLENDDLGLSNSTGSGPMNLSSSFSNNSNSSLSLSKSFELERSGNSETKQEAEGTTQNIEETSKRGVKRKHNPTKMIEIINSTKDKRPSETGVLWLVRPLKPNFEFKFIAINRTRFYIFYKKDQDQPHILDRTIREKFQPSKCKTDRKDPNSESEWREIDWNVLLEYGLTPPPTGQYDTVYTHVHWWRDINTKVPPGKKKNGQKGQQTSVDPMVHLNPVSQHQVTPFTNLSSSLGNTPLPISTVTPISSSSSSSSSACTPLPIQTTSAKSHDIFPNTNIYKQRNIPRISQIPPATIAPPNLYQQSSPSPLPLPMANLHTISQAMYGNTPTMISHNKHLQFSGLIPPITNPPPQLNIPLSTPQQVVTTSMNTIPGYSAPIEPQTVFQSSSEILSSKPSALHTPVVANSVFLSGGGRQNQYLANVETPPDFQQKMWKDEQVISLLLNPVNIISKVGNSFVVNEKEFLNRLKERFPHLNLNNLKLLIENKTESLTLDKLSLFLSRFGPLSWLELKINTFVEQGAKLWYHGNLSKEAAVSLLRTHVKNEGTCYYLVHNAFDDLFVFDGLLNVFTVSFAYMVEDKTNEGHVPVFATPENDLCCQIQSKNDEPQFQILESWNIKSVFHIVPFFLKFVEMNTLIPVSCSYHVDLESSQNVSIAQQQVKQANFVKSRNNQKFTKYDSV